MGHPLSLQVQKLVNRCCRTPLVLRHLPILAGCANLSSLIIFATCCNRLHFQSRPKIRRWPAHLSLQSQPSRPSLHSNPTPGFVKMDNFCDMLQTIATCRVFVANRCSLASRLQDCARKREVRIGLIAGLGICFGIGGRWPRNRGPRPAPSTAGLSLPPAQQLLSSMPMPQPG